LGVYSSTTAFTRVASTSVSRVAVSMTSEVASSLSHDGFATTTTYLDRVTTTAGTLATSLHTLPSLCSVFSTKSFMILWCGRDYLG